MEDGLPTYVVTRQLQVEHGTGKVRRSKTGVLPLCNAANHSSFMLLTRLHSLGFNIMWKTQKRGNVLSKYLCCITLSH